ncbi:MAG: hypothetical protein HQL14_07980 [Candidatus Omnitrophica bacterium]|nr:hypothetical protein [Candidatus Omnitrophota bacterium]
MNKIIFALTVLFLSITAVGIADQPDQVITLKDGSQIKGELSGVENGTYTVKTPTMGLVHVAAADVSSITNGRVAPPVATQNNAGNTFSLPPTAATNAGLDQQVAAQQQKLMSNPQAMADVAQIAQDPEIMQLLSDPALVQAVTSHDFSAVQNNPKIKELMSNPKMQALLQKLATQQQQQQTTSSQ